MKLLGISRGTIWGAVIFMAMLCGRVQAATPPWQLTGDFSEACSCSVPCSCNFGENPSPHAFCYALFSLDIQSGHYGDVKLDGLHLAGGGGAKGLVLYIDERADTQQAAALTAVAKQMWEKAV